MWTATGDRDTKKKPEQSRARCHGWQGRKLFRRLTSSSERQSHDSCIKICSSVPQDYVKVEEGDSPCAVLATFAFASKQQEQGMSPSTPQVFTGLLNGPLSYRVSQISPWRLQMAVESNGGRGDKTKARKKSNGRRGDETKARTKTQKPGSQSCTQKAQMNRCSQSC